MLTGSHAFSGFAVADIDAARSFYAGTLGLDVRDGDESGLIELHFGGTRVIVYPKPDHVPATYTILTFPVDDIDVAVDALVAAGVEMARYPGSPQDDKGIARDPRGPKIAWFTDPSGNILSVLQV